MNSYDLIMDLVGKVSDISDLPAVGAYNIRADGAVQPVRTLRISRLSPRRTSLALTLWSSRHQG